MICLSSLKFYKIVLLDIKEYKYLWFSHSSLSARDVSLKYYYITHEKNDFFSEIFVVVF